MDTTPARPAFASVTEAMDIVLAGLSYLVAADAAQLADETQAECLRKLERADAITTAARACFLAAFTAGKGYCPRRLAPKTPARRSSATTMRSRRP